MSMSYAHTAAIVVAAIAAPNVANATSTVTADPIMVADVVKMTTDLVNAITYGSAKGAKQLTPQQQSTLKFGVQILVQKALASGMTWRELMFALAKGVGKSEAGILGRAVGNYISVIAYEYWAAAGAAWNSVTLPLPLIYIMYGPEGCPGCNPGMAINYEDIYLPYPDSDYWTAPGEDYPYGYDSYDAPGEGGEDGWAESGDADGSSGSSSSPSSSSSSSNSIGTLKRTREDQLNEEAARPPKKEKTDVTSLPESNSSNLSVADRLIAAAAAAVSAGMPMRSPGSNCALSSAYVLASGALQRVRCQIRRHLPALV